MIVREGLVMFGVCYYDNTESDLGVLCISLCA